MFLRYLLINYIKKILTLVYEKFLSLTFSFIKLIERERERERER